MKRLLKTYGNEIFLLDATYKTTRYAPPLLFMMVKTNVNYEVVGTFVCEGERTENIISTLKILKSWNPDWSLLYSMVDCWSEEINELNCKFVFKIFLFCCLTNYCQSQIYKLVSVILHEAVCNLQNL